MLRVITSIFAPKIVFSLLDSRSISGSCTIRIFILTRWLEALRIMVLVISYTVFITAVTLIVELVLQDFILLVFFDLLLSPILLWFGIPAHSNIWIFWVLIRSMFFGSSLFLAFFLGWFLFDFFLLLTLSVIIIADFFFVHVCINIVVDCLLWLLLNVIFDWLKGVLTSILDLLRLLSILHSSVWSIGWSGRSLQGWLLQCCMSRRDGCWASHRCWCSLSDWFWFVWAQDQAIISFIRVLFFNCHSFNHLLDQFLLLLDALVLRYVFWILSFLLLLFFFFQGLN